MDISLFQDFAFPVALVIILGVYIAQSQKTNREDLLRREEVYRQDNMKREETYRQDTKDREEKLMSQLGEMSATNKILLETNAVLAREINTKLDQIIKRQVE